MSSPILVLKFGGASVAKAEFFSTIADIIRARKESYSKVVAVVSAMGNMTNDLIALAKRVHPDPPRREYDMLVTVGERISVSLLAMALSRKGVKAMSFTGSQSGIITSDTHSDAIIVDVRPRRLIEPLERGDVVIVAGFQGMSSAGEITTLGRGGSDTTAVALAAALSADRVEFYKDVRGVYSEDPKEEPSAFCHRQLSYREADEILQRGGRILHRRSLHLAELNNVPLQVRSFIDQSDPGTAIGGKGRISERPQYEDALSHTLDPVQGFEKWLSRELLPVQGG